MNDTLKPCPFCGGPAVGPENQTGGTKRPMWQVRCYQWCVTLTRPTQKAALNDWNARTEQKTQYEITACYFPGRGEVELSWQALFEDGRRCDLTLPVTPEQGAALVAVIDPCMHYRAVKPCNSLTPVSHPRKPDMYRREVHKGWPEWSENNVFSDGNGGGEPWYRGGNT